MLLSKELLDKPFFSMTGSEIVELFSTVFPQQQATEILDYTDDRYVRGIDGLKKLLKCGRTKAQSIKSSGVINDAIIQDGKIIIIDAKLALELIKKNKKKTALAAN
ncbi:hypothetical protein BAS10_04655 [Elizabethkingia meningoseptica]|uniref:DUF3853 family protein n=1 Tax=Elizabethkingia meningoseptica TaxID=238 RepID=UPI00099B189F|nr:DUF3853 family protein [Elizabethkingia meningoseptica]OPB98961.1 hypothetical protein BAS10_04655 [Elizabethkingia meningoseptica]